jgi:hypothetical protein
MGFRTVAIQKKGAEVWRVLGAAKMEFQKFGKLMAKVESQVSTVQNTLKDISSKTRTINRTLKDREPQPLYDRLSSPTGRRNWELLLPAGTASGAALESLVPGN